MSLSSRKPSSRGSGPYRAGRESFTLVEMMVSIALFLIIVSVLVSVASLATRISTQAEGDLSSFQEANGAFNNLTRNLSQAVLNTYIAYYPDPTLATNGVGLQSGVLNVTGPQVYVRKSELHFVICPATNYTTGVPSIHPTSAVFFQEPVGNTTNVVNGYFGLEAPLCSAGYFIEFGDNSAFLPSFRGTQVTTQNRFRLMQFLDTTENMAVYGAPFYTPSYTWITGPLALSGTSRPVRAIADNIIALIFTPELAPGDVSTGTGLSGFPTNYTYDSKILTGNTTNGIWVGAPAGQPVQPVQQYQLPPIVNVTMVAIDENSARRLAAQNGTNAPNFGLSTLFQSTNNFTSDLQTLENTLHAQNLNYRVFQSDVAMRDAKWNSP